ncbi:GGDEF domain-containing protein [Saccharophagus degradans]|uniref:diguanylate cyclase n=1 Tax=Saccharophagus degradans TaxID=86304 RepID=A0AAW7X713_9GAMM|nr:diguanylate cyclase [Saccharophagus degradans]MBU2986664.1 GGDEF domain-containing protein [Saccharophagus degradans]MDO6422662.1 diguanylate cyclase [Saccharophagus degradans]MDO6609643.1 diguanylate cyclase [Saccharophagus degradans]WGO98567.1 diguanylate cyclase [Saccharophagus degradans]
MLRTQMHYHKRWLIAGTTWIYLQILTLAMLAPLKPFAQFEWLDIVGEGAAAAVILFWSVLVLASRPKGRVTNLLVAGLLAVFSAMLQDFLDEIFNMHAMPFWQSLIESACLPLGMTLLTVGIFYWRQEQIVVNQQLRKREKLFRHHQWVDAITSLASITYLKEYLHNALQHTHQRNVPVTLLLLDLNEFNQVNKRYGNSEGDRALYAVSELLMLNLRDDDLICRYAGDRFAILLANTREHEAEIIAIELVNAILHFAHRTKGGERVYLNATAGIAYARDTNLEKLIDRAKHALRIAKDANATTYVAL